MSASKHPTQRSRLLGFYLQAKALLWIALGIALGWGLALAGDVSLRDGVRTVAFFLLMFLVPGVLLWVLGVTVRVRHRTCWWFSMAYLIFVVVAKGVLGATELPLEAWSWVSFRLPPFYLRGFEAFAVFTTLLLAADIAALASFISPQGRACFGVGKVTREALDQVQEEGE